MTHNTQLTKLANAWDWSINKPQVILLSFQRSSPLSLSQTPILTQERQTLQTPSAFYSLRIPSDPVLIPSVYPKAFSER